MTETEILNDEIITEAKDADLVSKQNITLASRNIYRSDDNVTSTPIWLISFTDVIALMLTFFVLLYAMSNPEIEKWENKIGTPLHNAASFSGPKNNSGSQEGINMNRIDFQTAENLSYLQGLFDDFILNNSENQKVTLKMYANRVLIIFPDASIDNQELKSEFLLFLKQLTPLLKSLDNKITLSIYNKKENNIVILQKIGQELNKNGYDQDISLQIHSDSKLSKEILIIIDAHNGQRITR
jgi:chemotaxis protein MotB